MRNKVIYAGLIAVTANTLLLKLAPLLHIKAESGGLLKLTILYTHLPVPQPVSTPLWLGFHYLTGFVMVAVYALFFERLQGPKWLKGSLFSLLPWLINGLIVSPLLQQGIFSYKAIPASGMAWFFMANWIFGFLLGVLQ